MLIAGWVAMWRPLEIFLYDWWPIRRRIRVLGKLSAMPIVAGAVNTKLMSQYRPSMPPMLEGIRRSNTEDKEQKTPRGFVSELR